MYEFLRIQYILENIDKEKLYSYVPMFITEEEYEKIIK